MKNLTKMFMLTGAFLLCSMLMHAQIMTIGPTAKGIQGATDNRAMLYDQISNPGTNGGVTSQDFETAYNAYDAESADDFTVPPGAPWIIDNVQILGSYSTTGPCNLANIRFFTDNAGMPGTLIVEHLAVNANPDATGNLDVDIPPTSLSAGTYWISFQGKLDYATGGQWYMGRQGPPTNGNEFVWQNPANGFGSGYTSFVYGSLMWPSQTDYNLSFALNGALAVPCDWQIALIDQYGDGWNGGLVTVYVNGTPVLTDITLASGAGPEYHSFSVTTGAEITTAYTAGGWSGENTYEILDSDGTVVYTDGAGYATPTGIGPGILFGACPTLGNVDGYVFNGDGLLIVGATVGIDALGMSTNSGTDGYYTLLNVPSGDQILTGFKSGYNIVNYNITVVAGTTIAQDIVLTKPTMIINPLTLNETLHPNEYRTKTLGILNTGDGPLDWEAEITYLSDKVGSVNGVPYQDVLAMNNIEPYENVQDLSGLAPEGGNNYPLKNAPNGNIGRDVDSEAWGYNAYDPSGATPVGGITFLLNDPGTITSIGPAASNFIAGADFAGDIYYGCIYGGTWGTMDVATGAWTTIGSCPDFSGVAYDATSDVMYGTTFAGSLYTVDVTTGSTTLVGSGGSSATIAMACTADGELYGIDITSDAFGHIDKATGVWTTVSNVGFDAAYAQDMGCDRSTNTIYWAAYNGSAGQGELLTIDHVTGDVTFIGTFAGGAEITGFAVPGTGGTPGGWLTLGQYEGNVAAGGGSYNLPVNFNAEGFEAGDYVTAEITFTSAPDVGTIVIPVSMTIIGDPLTPPENLEVILVNDIIGEVDLSWEWNGDAFQYFKVERNGIFLASVNTTSYTDILPDYGEYCYTVKAVYDEGETAPAGPECIMWSNPGLFISPNVLEAWVWMDHQVTVSTTISNIGIGTLAFVFPMYDNADAFSCEHEVILVDTYGDGWNGGALTVYVDGVVVLNGITVASGGGPESYYFTAESGQEITTTYVAGSWSYENEYEILDGEGNTIATDGMGGATPSGIGPGVCYAYCPQPSFIIDVDPSSGFIAEGAAREITITYDATGFVPGDYIEWLYVESNDPDHLTDSIHNTMHVTEPAMIAGNVTDANTGGPLGGVIVTADMFNTSTDDNGDYMIYVDPGLYDVHFDKIGYTSVVVYDTAAIAGVVTTVDAMMYEALYMPGWVLATVNDDDTECLVEWTVPWGPYEVVYEDGSVDDYLVYTVGGNAHAVKFTPAGYPADILGGSVFVGDGSFPIGADFMGSTFGLAIMDDDGTDGMPGTVLDTVEVTVNNYGWITISGLSAVITEGDFYITMFQGSMPPGAAPIGIDQSMPTVYRSYTYIKTADLWSMSAYQDFMIRAIVSGPQTGADMVMAPEKVQPPRPMYKHYIATGNPNGIAGYVKSGENRPAPEFATESQRESTGYKLARFSNFDPDNSPLLGDTIVLEANVNALSENDEAFGGLDEGWYAFGVAARYNQGGNVWSDYMVSNIVGHLKTVAVTVNVTTTNGEIADSTEIVLTGLDFPTSVYTHFTDETATVTFDPVWKGTYDLYVYKVGYEAVMLNGQFIGSDREFNIVLAEKRYAPYNLYVDPLTSIATWNAPRITALKEDFEGTVFPPDGWTSTTEAESGIGWFRTDDGASDYFVIPEWDSYYACSNDDAQGSVSNGCCDFLITPALDLRETSGYSLKFDQYYTAEYSEIATVEISMDAGATWTVEQAMSAGAAWSAVSIDLSAYSHDPDIAAIWIAFHADDSGEQASGWAIDNVEVSVGEDGDWPSIGYHLFLDDALVVETTETTYQFLNLTYGVEYTASVGALYSSGLSEKDYYTWTSEWLYPPENLVGVSYDNAVHLIWDPPCSPWFDVLSVGPRTVMPNPNTEYSPMYREIRNNAPANRDLWDTQFTFACGDASGEAGIESDGTYIYTTKWNAGSGTFFRYELDGTFLGSFTVTGGCQDVRDLAYDGEYFYGSNASTSVWQMDFDAEVVVSTISAPVATRAVAYDGDFDGLWANNWSDNITLFDMNGVQLNSFACGSYSSYYGFAWDDGLAGGPYLYGFSQDASLAMIVEIEIATGTETGVTYDAAPFGSGGSAGGLFIQGGIVPDFKTLGGLIQNEAIFGLEFGPDSGQPTTCSTPDNVIGFNVYRDGDFQEYVEYFGEDQISWWQYDLMPGLYLYTVTAVYDLAPYGFPGQEDESMEEGPAIIRVSYGFPLPFMENWETGSFETKDWEVQCDNWELNSVIGNPGFSAEFKWDPIQENYDCGLVTYPIVGHEVVDGDIYLDFDLKIDDRFDTVETEKLVIRVWADGEWMDKGEVVAIGDVDWESYHMKISVPAKGSDFRVGFFAVGESSINIDAWFIDNVHIYQLCAEPTNLLSDKVFETMDEGVVELNWTPPGATHDEWISYNDGSFENAIASTTGGAGLAQVFTPTQYPVTLTEVRYFNSSYEQYMLQCEIYVLTGDGATVLAGPYYVSDGPADDWVTVDVDDVTLESGTFMVSTFNVAAGGPYVGMDDSFYDGSLFFGSIGAFDEMGTFGYYYVGSHEAHVEYAVGDNVVVNSVLTAPQASNSNPISNVKLSGTSASAPAPASRELTGYNIWRNDELIEANWPETQYFDTVYESMEYCYYVSALYDQCESDTLGYVCESFFDGIGDNVTGALEIYPNPTSDRLTIVSPIAIERITVMNYVGQVVYDETVADETMLELSVANYESGVYFIKVETADGIATERVTVTK
jgi:type IX secretion system substrate protein/carboxypeptidase family protein